MGEEPLEIRVNGRPLTVTMRTPGHDVELAMGHLVSEGVITSQDQLVTARYCAGATEDGVNTYNVLDLALAPGVVVPESSIRHENLMSSSCGVCGKTSIDDVVTRSSFDLSADQTSVKAELLAGFPEALREAQEVFNQTGGLHAAGLFDADSGRLLCAREDVGRHNAVDKVIGWALTEGRLPLTGTVLLVSGRAGFELVQKASMAGVPVTASVSATTSLATDRGEKTGVAVVGFLRGRTMAVYTHPERVTP